MTSEPVGLLPGEEEALKQSILSAGPRSLQTKSKSAKPKPQPGPSASSTPMPAKKVQKVLHSAPDLSPSPTPSKGPPQQPVCSFVQECLLLKQG